MPARILSAALKGIEALPVAVEVEVLGGLPSFTVVGLTDRAIQESRERLTAALSNLGYEPPRRKTIVSLAPASVKKEGSLYDLPIAFAYLIASKQIMPAPSFLNGGSWFVGELGLDGTVRSVPGILPIVLAAARRRVPTLFVPAGNVAEAAAVADRMTIYAIRSLQELLAHVTAGEETLNAVKPTTAAAALPAPDIDFADIRGQDHAKRAMTVAAAGNHNVLMVGPPGTGKTMLARALAGILPPLTRAESYVVTSLYSVAGLLPEGVGLKRQRPYRGPHHGASAVALVGGGADAKPGEVSLAHGGVLFLDELPEFSRHVLNQLRQPIEDGAITVSRARQTIRYPARAILVGAMNPCPCGYFGSDHRSCRCTAGDIIRYQRRLSGPLLDRFDLQLAVGDVPLDELLATSPLPGAARSADLMRATTAARARQHRRQGKTNGELMAREVTVHCALDRLGTTLLRQAQDRFHLSARGVHRLLKVARTIADLTGVDHMQSSHVAEAIQYRQQLQEMAFV